MPVVLGVRPQRASTARCGGGRCSRRRLVAARVNARHRGIAASILRLAECTARSTPSAPPTGRRGAGRGEHIWFLVCAKGAFPADDSASLGRVSLIIIICMNTPEGCQHGTHSFSIYRVIKLIPPVLGIPAHTEQTRETQARTPNPKRPGIVHSQCVPGAEG